MGQRIEQPTAGRAGPEDKIYSVTKIAAIVEAITAEGVPEADILRGIELPKGALSSPATRVSLNQIIECYQNAMRHARNPLFAFSAGLKVHLSAYGMYGFAMLSSIDFRKTMEFAVRYHRLATPLTDISFREENSQAVWTITPIAHPLVDRRMYRFLVELQMGIHFSLLRDVMGPSFLAREIAVTYAATKQSYSPPPVFGCAMRFSYPRNELAFDATWLDRSADLGNEVTHAALVALCDRLMDEFNSRTGIAGKVRELLLTNFVRPTRFSMIAERLHMTLRTLRRRLDEECTSYRQLLDETRMHVAIRYLRDTDLAIDEIAYSLGFNEAAAFRRAFQRWTNRSPLEFQNDPNGK